MQTDATSRNRAGFTIVMVGAALMPFCTPAAHGQTVYYDVWRGASDNPTAASQVASWLEQTEWTDPDVVEGEAYNYWVRATQTQANDSAAVGFAACPPVCGSARVRLFCPTAAERGDPNPVPPPIFRLELRIFSSNFFSSDYSCTIRLYKGNPLSHELLTTWEPTIHSSGAGVWHTIDALDLMIDVWANESQNSDSVSVYAEIERGGSTGLSQPLIILPLNPVPMGPPFDSIKPQAEGLSLTWYSAAYSTGFGPMATGVWLPDCNENQLPDACDVDCGVVGGSCDVVDCGLSADCDVDGVPDECEADSDIDGVIDDCDDCPGTIPSAIVDEFGCPAQIPGDSDRDGDIDLRDHQRFQRCLGSDPSTECRDAFDPDGDGDVDLDDWVELEPDIGGPGQPPGGPGPSGMVLVPGGEYLMGTHYESWWASLPVHSVFVDTFRMDTYEVTNALYRDGLNWALGRGLISVTKGVVYRADGTEPYCLLESSSINSRITWNGSAFAVVSGKEQHPMVEVSWYGAAAYANWRSAMEGRALSYDLDTWTCDFSANGYRLPTEAEWEKAARGGHHDPYQRYPWGNTLSGGNANYRDSGDPSETESHSLTTPVGYYDGSQIPKGPDMINTYGLYDIAGNVYEWCHDRFHLSGYSPCDPPPCVNPLGPTTGAWRIVRGGSWYDLQPDVYLQCAARANVTPDGSTAWVGFRLVLGSH